MDSQENVSEALRLCCRLLCVTYVTHDLVFSVELIVPIAANENSA
jgi:hypothetical protein